MVETFTRRITSVLCIVCTAGGSLSLGELGGEEKVAKYVLGLLAVVEGGVLVEIEIMGEASGELVSELKEELELVEDLSFSVGGEDSSVLRSGVKGEFLEGLLLGEEGGLSYFGGFLRISLSGLTGYMGLRGRIFSLTGRTSGRGFL